MGAGAEVGDGDGAARDPVMTGWWSCGHRLTRYVILKWLSKKSHDPIDMVEGSLRFITISGIWLPG